MSLARRHREHCAAHAITVAAAGGATAYEGAATEQQLVLVRLGVDLRRLKDIQSIERKIELKAELIPAYDDWIAGVLGAGTAVATGARDDVVTTIMIWALDVEDFDRALPICEYVLQHDIPLPERFDRTAPTLICEETADAALKRLGQGQTFPRDVLELVAELVEDEDIFDQVRAKLSKALGLSYALGAEAMAAGADGPAGLLRATWERALAYFQRATALDPKVGVKKRIDAATRAIAAATEPPPA